MHVSRERLEAVEPVETLELVEALEALEALEPLEAVEALEALEAPAAALERFGLEESHEHTHVSPSRAKLPGCEKRRMETARQRE